MLLDCGQVYVNSNDDEKTAWHAPSAKCLVVVMDGNNNGFCHLLLCNQLPPELTGKHVFSLRLF